MEKKKVISLRFTKEQHAQLKKEAGMVSLHRYIIFKLFELDRLLKIDLPSDEKPKDF